MLQLTFKQTKSELLVRAAASILFGTLVRSGAKLVKLGELAEKPQYGFTASAATEPVGPRFVRITDLKDGTIYWETVPFCECPDPEKYLIRDDDLLFARTGATTGKTHHVRDAEKAVFASYLIRLRPKPGVLAGYLYAFFQSDGYWAQISDEKEGSAQPNVNGEKLAGIEIPAVDPELQAAIAEFLRCVRRRQDGEVIALPQLPPPLSEQRRVVARIEELSAQIHEARTLRRQATQEADALLQNHVEGRFSRLKAHYPCREFGSFQPHVTSGPRNWAKHYERSGPRFYRAQDIGSDGTISERSKVFITPPPGDQGRSAMLQAGDIMLVITGATVGRASVYRKGLEPGFVSQHVAICRLPQSEVDPEFVLWGLRGPIGQAQLLGQRYGQGKPGLNLTNIRSISLPFPSIPEQRHIVAELDALQAEVDALKRLQAETSAELDALLPAILDRAFKGEL